MASSSSQHVVIIGGGIIGCTTAYYLTKTKSGPATDNVPVKVTLIEASKNGPAQGASGKAGGLVAKWAYPKELVRISYPEHEKLAAEHNGKDRWGWRYVRCGTWEGRAGEIDGTAAVDLDGRRNLEKELGLPGGSKPLAQGRTEKGLPDDLLWVNEQLTDAYSPIAKDGDTAQVHPYLFTTSMFELAKEKGLEYIHGSATRILKERGRVSGVEYREGGSEELKTIGATHVVLAAGAWSSRIVEELPIATTRAHSVTIHPQPGVEIRQIYARPDNEVYACGPGDNTPLPATVDDVQVDSTACESIIRHVTAISEELKKGTVDKKQACYLPVVNTGSGPIVGEAEKIAGGLYVATGHTCWGICNAPGTALAITELILDGKIRCGNLQKLRPSVVL